MAVPEQIPYIEHVANGSTLNFPLGFYCESLNHLNVTINDVEVALGEITLEGDTVVFSSAPPVDSIVRILRSTPVERTTEFKPYDGSFNAGTINKDLDKVWIALQDFLAKHNITNNKLLELLDAVSSGQVNGLPGEIIARIAGDENLKLLLDQEYLRAFQAEYALTQKIDNDIAATEQLITNESNRAQDVESQLSTQISTLGVGNKAYKTYAEMDADKANLPAKSKVTVTNDATVANNGDWQWDGVVFTKSSYDPLTQANSRMDANPLFEPVGLSANADFNNLPLTASGFFRVNAQASTMLNIPEQSNGFGFESVDSLGNKTQWYISQPLNNFWFRTKWNGVWKDWKKNADATQVIPVTSQKTGAQTLASYKDQGIYNFASTATISDLPSDAQAGVGYTLKVENYLSGDRFKIQYLRCDSAKTGLKWERSVDKQNNTEGTWILTPRLHDGQIVPENLSASFRYKGSFTSVAISDYKSDGLYTFITPTDKPVGASSTSGTVEVKNWFSGTMVLQTWVTWTKPNEVFMRYINSSGIGEWVSQNSSGGNSQFAGKKIVCFGDSITEFGTYPTQMANRLGATGYNIGFGGCRWGKHSNALYDEMCMYKVADYIATDNLTGLMDAAIALRDSSQADDNTAQVARLQSLDLSTVDYVTIFHGTNDFQGLIPIGTDSDTTGDTFKGAINLSLDKLLTKYPNMKLLLVTPIWRARQVSGDDLESDANPNSLGLYLRDYVEAIKDMGKKYHVPVLDLYNNSGIGKYTKNLYLSSDELHPNTVGYTHLANLIAAKLSSTY